MSVRELDTEKQEAFAGHVVEVLNDACVGLMASIGHQTGLFDRMAGLAPSTAGEIARAAGLNERYVREWLGCMVVAGFVEYDPERGTYTLPPEHAASLTRAAGPENMAAMMPFLAMMGEVEQELLGHFRTGGGMPYSAYPRFQRLQAEETARVYDLALVDAIVPLVPGLTERLRAGADALDVGTGQGHAVTVLAKAFPESRFTGIDISAEGIAAARESAAGLGLRNARFEVADSAELTGTYDLVTAFDVIHDLARPTRTLAAIAGALRPDGVFLMGDVAASSRLEENVDHPLAPALYTFSTFYCMTVSLGEGGEGLGTVWGEQTARRMLAEAGFGSVDVEQVEGDVRNLYDVARPDGAAGR
ncbi:class I SAM-dependent methyltransferase [Streptomyces rubellomurinus]|uniref:Transcriptional regulator n=1 Tax=Streptomyces rubellomurinus (strain ATCC 31215) TaxID=359131 RepID=A0A0F2TF39_STRR3|nr:class I SAM-dependent methyltransferase [Streptomyces rubellomurinus]KJS61818.1 transcriptional regulator [Streptomyces rubellomurinus]